MFCVCIYLSSMNAMDNQHAIQDQNREKLSLDSSLWEIEDLTGEDSSSGGWEIEDLTELPDSASDNATSIKIIGMGRFKDTFSDEQLLLENARNLWIKQGFMNTANLLVPDLPKKEIKRFTK